MSEIAGSKRKNPYSVELGESERPVSPESQSQPTLIIPYPETSPSSAPPSAPPSKKPRVNGPPSNISLDDYIKTFELKTFKDYIQSKPQLSDPVQGGTSRVYTVKFALKKVQVKPGFVEAIYNEIRALSILNKTKCNCAPRLISVEKVDEYIYIIQSYTDGKTLQDWLKTNPSPDEKEKRKKELENALKQIHEHGIRHADIKPSNIWIPSDARTPAYFIDFGSAVIGDEKATSFTPSPEGSPLDSESELDKKNTKALERIFQLPTVGGKHKNRQYSHKRKKLNKTRRHHKRHN